MLRSEIEKYLHMILRVIAYLTIALIVYFAFRLLFIYFTPFITAMILSFIIEPIVKFFQKLKLKRGISVLLSILLFLGGFVAFSIFAVTRIVYELIKLYERLPNYYDGLYNLTSKTIQQVTDLYLQLPPEALNIIQDVLKTVFGKITGFLSHTTTVLINPAAPISFKPANIDISVTTGCMPNCCPTIFGSIIYLTTVIIP